MIKERHKIKAAVYLLPVKDGQVLLSRRFNTGWKDGWYSLISGHLDGNESVTDSVIRETLEEAGIKINKKDLIPIKSVHHKTEDSEYVDFFFEINKWEGTPKIMEKDKCDDMSWFAVNQLPKNILPHVKHVIETRGSGGAFFEFGWD